MNSVPPSLSSRVDAPQELPLPDHQDVALWRPASLQDVDAIAAMQVRSDRVDHPEWVTPREDFVDDFRAAHVDLARDTLVAFDADGAVAAFGSVILGPGQDTRVQSYLPGSVRPDLRGRGIGRRLLDWQKGRSMQQLATSDKTVPGWSMVDVADGNHAALALAQDMGFVVSRYFTTMNRIAAEPVPELEAPEGIRIVPCTPDLFETTRIARNDAFRDHWGSQPRMPEEWAKITGNSQFRPELSWVAVTGDDADVRVVAFALTSLNEHNWEAQGFSSGYVELIGVVRDWRGRRLAPALISRLLSAFGEAGLERAVLDVDTASPTGANGLYERLGFTAGPSEIALVIEY